MEIRKLGIKDYSMYKVLRQESFEVDPESFGTSSEDEKGSSEDVRKKNFEKAVQEGDNFILGVFESNERLVGMAQFTRDQRKKLNHKSKLGSVYLSPSTRGRGVASQLISTLISEASQLSNLDKISLMVVDRNIKAIKLYEKLGFTVYGKEPCAIKDNHQYYDYQLMVLFINNAKKE
ncbi:MAG: GNAT family N-acetyltransferase [Turicibacter sp.]